MEHSKVAKICHEANRFYCEAVGDFSQKPWDESPQWQRDSAIKGVDFHSNNPGASVSASHDSWMKEKVDSGWVYGEEKNAEKKTHPCIVSFDELPWEQQLKDYLFRSIVHSLCSLKG